jgi:hypothetical protein
MTTSQIDKILDALTELRVAAEARFAALEAKLDSLAELRRTQREHEHRISALELSDARSGRLSGSDVAKLIVGVGGVVGIAQAAWVMLHN